jgi:hypothetical protein
MLQKFLTVALLVLLFLTGNYGQEKNSPASVIKEYFDEAMNGKSISVSPAVLEQIPLPELIDQSKPFLYNKDPFVRYKAIDLFNMKGALLKNSEDKKIIVTLLIEACKDSDGGNSGVASKALLLYALNDFTPQAADSLVSLLTRRHFYYERIIRIAGFLQTTKANEVLNDLHTKDTTITKKEKWAVDLALARMGNQESLEYCMGKITSVPVNDQSLAYLFPDLIYMRQPASINYMLQEVLSDEKKCRSSNPDKEEKIICAFKILELVAPVIAEFPVKLTSYGELDIENYDEALKAVREWIKQDKPYSLIRYIY